MAVIEQLGYAQQRKFPAQQLADSRLRNIKKFFKLPGSDSLSPDELEDVLVQIGLQLKLQTVLCAHIKLIENASPGPMGDGRVDDQFLVLVSQTFLPYLPAGFDIDNLRQS